MLKDNKAFEVKESINPKGKQDTDEQNKRPHSDSGSSCDDGHDDENNKKKLKMPIKTGGGVGAVLDKNGSSNTSNSGEIKKTSAQVEITV